MNHNYALESHYQHLTEHVHGIGQLVNGLNGIAIVVLIISGLIALSLYMMSDNKLGCKVSLSHKTYKLWPKKVYKWYKRSFIIALVSVALVIILSFSGIILVHKQASDAKRYNYYHYRVGYLQYKNNLKYSFGRRYMENKAEHAKRLMNHYK